MDLEFDEAPELEKLGLNLAIARLERGLSQSELGARCGLAQAQISYFEVEQRRPTLDQFLRIARALDVSVQRLIGGSDRPGIEVRDMAVELRHLGIADLRAKGALIPGAFRRVEEVIALTVSAREPDPRIIEAIPAVMAWNELEPVLLRAYGLTRGRRTTWRLAWLADVALAIARQGGFPGGCKKEPLEQLTRIIRPPEPGRERWDSLGRPTEAAPKSPLWKRWKISYDASLAEFEERARHLEELRERAGNRPKVKSAARCRKKLIDPAERRDDPDRSPPGVPPRGARSNKVIESRKSSKGRDDAK